MESVWELKHEMNAYRYSTIRDVTVAIYALAAVFSLPVLRVCSTNILREVSHESESPG